MRTQYAIETQGRMKLGGPRTVPVRSGPDGLQTPWFFEHPGLILCAANRDDSRSDPEHDVALINTSLQRGDLATAGRRNRFSGFPHPRKPLKRSTLVRTCSYSPEGRYAFSVSIRLSISAEFHSAIRPRNLPPFLAESTADWKSAIQQIENLRYLAAGAQHVRSGMLMRGDG